MSLTGRYDAVGLDLISYTPIQLSLLSSDTDKGRKSAH